jgi:hypothetical protein
VGGEELLVVDLRVAHQRARRSYLRVEAQALVQAEPVQIVTGSSVWLTFGAFSRSWRLFGMSLRLSAQVSGSSPWELAAA